MNCWQKEILISLITLYEALLLSHYMIKCGIGAKQVTTLANELTVILILYTVLLQGDFTYTWSCLKNVRSSWALKKTHKTTVHGLKKNRMQTTCLAIFYQLLLGQFQNKYLFRYTCKLFSSLYQSTTVYIYMCT